MQIGGDSLDIPIPVQMCLPITELQRRAEELEFSELLDQVRHLFTGQSHVGGLEFDQSQRPNAVWVDFTWQARHISDANITTLAHHLVLG